MVSNKRGFSLIKHSQTDIWNCRSYGTNSSQLHSTRQPGVLGWASSRPVICFWVPAVPCVTLLVSDKWQIFISKCE